MKSAAPASAAAPTLRSECFRKTAAAETDPPHVKLGTAVLPDRVFGPRSRATGTRAVTGRHAVRSLPRVAAPPVRAAGFRRDASILTVITASIRHAAQGRRATSAMS